MGRASRYLSAAFSAVLLVVSAYSTCLGARLYEDMETGQVFARPGGGRTPFEVSDEAARRLYEDAKTGMVYARAGVGRRPLAGRPGRQETAGPAVGRKCAASADTAKHTGRRDGETYPGVRLGMEAFIGYFNDLQSKKDENKFALNRGYLNVKARLTPWLSARLTPDITRKADGDLELRLKYLYARFHGFLDAYPSLSVKLGQFQGAWLDHVEHLWTYRVQGTMLIEREGFMNSANLGVDFEGDLPGGYGHWQANVNNGEGYHADERNRYKSFQARLTLHPLPRGEWTRGLEVSGFVTGGKQDALHERDRAIAFAGYRHADDFFAGGEYLWTRGRDDSVSRPGINNVKGAGFSLLGWYRMPFLRPLRLMARFDDFDHDTDTPGNTVRRYIYGVSWDAGRYATFLLSGERTVRGKGGFRKTIPDENLLKMDLLLTF